ncbi:ribonuclease H-like domain-containing protein [Tanacetum coccineum]|uniref:Ribonuclease H-like domain-containing protein n=1 Tax=Tanacetum coccineum TaxID=301880 RepID=A0ABQ5ILF5_9ASTR
MVDGGDDPKKKGKEVGSSELNLDIYDPLYLHPQEIGSQLITFKLKGTENYKVWSAVVQLALHTRNKIRFINEKCIRVENAGPLQDQWDRCNAVVLSWLLGTVKDHGQLLRLMQFLIGLDDMYNSVRSLILTTEPLPDLRSAFATLSRDESHRNSGLSSKSVKIGPTAFVSRPSNGNNWNTNKIGNNNNNNFGSNRRFERMSNLVCKHCNMTGHTIDRCFELVGYPPGFKRNNSSQSNTNNTTSNDIKTDHSKSVPNTLTNDQYQRLMALLSDTVTHPNRTVELVKSIESYKLANDLIIKDMLVVLGYHVSLTSVHKLSRDNKVIVSFNGSKCKIQDLTQSFLMGTGSEKEGLYFLDEDSADNGNKSAPKGSVNSLNDNTIGDAAKDQSHVQTENTDTIDLSGSSPSRKVNQDNQYATETEVSEGIQNTTDNDDNYESEGEDLKGSGQLFESLDQQAVGQNLRRSSRKSTLLSKFKNYELNKNVKYIIKDSRWVEAMNQEIEALNRNNTWVITELPENTKAIGYKWIYKVKYKANGDVERFKARLVAKGFNQREGIDYEETFSPVVKIVTIRCILTIVVNNKWPLFQLGINNAFLYGELEEDVYMSIPEGYSDQGDKRVCKLVKSLYGLKQAPRKWNEKLTSVLIENAFKQSLNDFSLFVKNDKDVMLIQLVYVDDIIVTGNNVNEINKFKQFLGSKFLTKIWVN